MSCGRDGEGKMGDFFYFIFVRGRAEGKSKTEVDGMRFTAVTASVIKGGS